MLYSVGTYVPVPIFKNIFLFFIFESFYLFPPEENALNDSLGNIADVIPDI